MRNSAFFAMFGTALVGASMMSVACVAEESAGSAGSSGSAGNSAGSAGTAAGTGGTAGKAGTAGTGGSTGGVGGAGAGGAGAGGVGGSSAGGAGAGGAGAGGAGAGGAGAGGAGAPAFACTAGSFQCTGQVLEECNAAGTAVTTKATCTATETCNATMGKCVPFACTPGQFRCTGNDLEKCNAGGTAFAVDKSCAAAEVCNAADAKCDTPTPVSPTLGYVRFAQLVPSAGQTAYDVCIRLKGSTNWSTDATTGDATQIFKDYGDAGEFYYPTISTYFEFPTAGEYEFRFVAGSAANCDVPSTKLPGDPATGAYLLTVPAGQVYTLVIYDKDASGKEKDLDIVAFANQAPATGKATVTWANAMTNVPALDFGSVVGNQFSDLQLSVAKKSSTISTNDPVSARIGSVRTDDINNKIHSITATDVDLVAGGVYTTFAYGVNEFAFGKLRPGIVVCNDIGTGTVSGSNTIASGCVYSAP